MNTPHQLPVASSAPEANSQNQGRPSGATLERAFGLDSLSALLRFRSLDEICAELSYRSIPCGAYDKAIDPAAKLDVLFDIKGAFLPNAKMLEFTANILASIRRLFADRDFNNPSYRISFYSNRQVFSGQALKPMPQSTRAIGEGCFTVTGPSLMGRSAFLIRLHQMLGKPFELRIPAPGGLPDSRLQMWCIPVLELTLLDCRSLQDLIAQIRCSILAKIPDPNATFAQLNALNGPNAKDAAIALCMLLNVALITVDGGCLDTLLGGDFEIFNFLIRFQTYSGIPIVILGTPVFSYIAGRAGSTSSKLFSGLSLHLDPLPALIKNKSNSIEPKGITYQHHEFFWSLGPVPKSQPVPPEIVAWIHGLTHGRRGWLAQAYHAIHTELCIHPELLTNNGLTQEFVENKVRQRLRNQLEARDYVQAFDESAWIPDEFLLLDYLDHLPSIAFENSAFSRRLSSIKLFTKRTQLMVHHA